MRDSLLEHMSEEEVNELEKALKEIADEHGDDTKDAKWDPQAWTDLDLGDDF